MPTRLNYTSRKRLNLEKFGIRIRPEDGQAASFDVDLNLQDLRPDHDAARVFIEAYRQSTRMRFDWGTVANPTPPTTDARRLTEFEDWKRILFRIKVTNVIGNDPGRLVAWRNRIRAVGPEDSPEQDLLYFENADLDGRVWDLRFDDDRGPVVQIDHRAGDRHDVGGNPKFQATVYPEIMRRTLTKAFVIDEENGDDNEHWSWSWLQEFLKPHLKLPDPPPLDSEPTARLQWIDSAVQAFARRHGFSHQWNPDAEERG